MPQTPLTSASSYLTDVRFFVLKDRRPYLELLADDDTVATYAGATDGGTSDAGKRLQAALQWASGEVESRAVVGGRYTPSDLAALTGNAKVRLEGIVADLAGWNLAKRRWPRLKMDEWAGAAEAVEALEQLRDGLAIFGTVEAADAGLPEVVTLDPGDDRRTVRAGNRFFGTRERR